MGSFCGERIIETNRTASGTERIGACKLTISVIGGGIDLTGDQRGGPWCRPHFLVGVHVSVRCHSVCNVSTPIDNWSDFVIDTGTFGWYKKLFLGGYKPLI